MSVPTTSAGISLSVISDIVALVRIGLLASSLIGPVVRVHTYMVSLGRIRAKSVRVQANSCQTISYRRFEKTPHRRPALQIVTARAGGLSRTSSSDND